MKRCRECRKLRRKEDFSRSGFHDENDTCDDCLSKRSGWLNASRDALGLKQ